MVDPNIKKKAEDIRRKIYGSDVRESLASGLEEMSEDVVETQGRQGEVEGQFQDVLDQTTNKDFNSAPEIRAARDGNPNLKARLDKEHQEVTAQLAQTENNIARRGINILELGFDIKTDGSNTRVELNKALEWCVDNGYSAFLPKGVYTVGREVHVSGEPTHALYIPDNLTMYVETGAVIKLKENEPEWTRVVQMGDNVEIYGHLEIDGSADTIENGNEHMAGLFLYNNKNVYIESLYSHNCYGDNVQISGDHTDGGSQFIIIDRLSCRKAGRKNLVIEFANFVRIISAKLDNKEGGTKGCLDVEPFNSNNLFAMNRIDYLETSGSNDFTGNPNQWMVIGTLVQHSGEFIVYTLKVKINEFYMYGDSHIICRTQSWLNIDSLYMFSYIDSDSQITYEPNNENSQLFIGYLKYVGTDKSLNPSNSFFNFINPNINISDMVIENYGYRILSGISTYESNHLNIGSIALKNCGAENDFLFYFEGTNKLSVNIDNLFISNPNDIVLNSIFRFTTIPSNYHTSIGNIINNQSQKLMSNSYGNFNTKVFNGGVILCEKSPVDTLEAPQGSIALNINGGLGSTFYVKESDMGSDGWAAK